MVACALNDYETISSRADDFVSMVKTHGMTKGMRMSERQSFIPYFTVSIITIFMI